jgi:iron(II)-dependent oxidoreductase
MKKFYTFAFLILISIPSVLPQSIKLTTHQGLQCGEYTDPAGGLFKLHEGIPFFTFLVGDKPYTLTDARAEKEKDFYFFTFLNGIQGEVGIDKNLHSGWKATIIIENKTHDTVDIANIVPFGESEDHIYLTSTGPWDLARAKIFRPGFGPVGVILPDNAWELGYAAIPVKDDLSLCALARRTKVTDGEMRRYRTIVYPGGKVEYTLWLDEYQGEWQNGLKLMFRDRYLYDLESFDNSLFEREDLKWIRNDYIIGLEFAWNQEYFDWKEGRYKFFEFLDKGKELFGGYDVFGLWPTWPRLGVDQRNQWDLFADMPGGLDKLKYFSTEMKKQGIRFFICYNPWDESTREENPYSGMARLIRATDADGVVLDTRGASSLELQRAADSVRPGVVMYSEGMAVVKDMPGIVSGRVHDAIVLPPPLNLNKLIKPEFGIFRVCQIHDGRIRREASIAFFNGYGTELNTFAPGRFESLEEDLIYLGRTTMTLRENTSSFLVHDWTPLIPVLADSIWVNKWPNGDKTIYTIFSLIPEGYYGPLFQEKTDKNSHLVSLWRHEEVTADTVNGQTYVVVSVESFNKHDLGTRAEGNVDCIARLPNILETSLNAGLLKLNSGRGQKLIVWAGNPSYQNKNFQTYGKWPLDINLMDVFGKYEGKFVIQLFDNDELLDENIIVLEPGTPRLLSNTEKIQCTVKAPPGMVKIPAGTFDFHTDNADQFIPYPEIREKKSVNMKSFYMDKYPVTNQQYSEFLAVTGYIPGDTVNFLKNWENGKVPKGLEDHPVVNVDLRDARAYARWAGKRLPTEKEWQYAAQGNDGRDWPWGARFDSTRCNNGSGITTPVNAFPRGKSPYGIMDMVGNIWQLTDDVYDNGTYYFVIMKGGSFYRPSSSWWYVKGGPQPAYWHQLLLLVSPGFDRNSTVGFRCVADAE